MVLFKPGLWRKINSECIVAGTLQDRIVFVGRVRDGSCINTAVCCQYKENKRGITRCTRNGLFSFENYYVSKTVPNKLNL